MTTKRKRSSDLSSNDLPLNPFYSRSKKKSRKDDRLDQVLIFLELTQKKQISRSGGGCVVDPQVLSSVQSLLQSLSEDNQTDSTSTLSRNNIVDVLLSWATKCLHYLASGDLAPNVDDIDICWRTMATCLDTDLLSRRELKISLSQSNLHKLIPFAAKCCFTTRPHRKTILNSTSRAYCIMVALYRPQTDHACRSLLPLISELIVNYPIPPVEGNQRDEGTHVGPEVSIVNATIELINSLRQAGSSNPKKIFQLLAEVKVMESIAILYRVGKRASKCRVTVRNLIFEGVFSQQHHMDGWSSLQFELESLRDAQKNKSNKTYQELLLRSLKEIASLASTGYNLSNLAALNAFIPLLLEGFISQTTIWRNTEEGSKKRGIIEVLQFGFWSVVWQTLRQQLECFEKHGTGGDTWRLSVLESMNSSLKLVADSKVYTPTFDERGQANLEFLEQQSQAITKAMPMASSENERTEYLELLDRFAAMNHLVLHNSLSRVVVAAVTCGTVNGPNLSVPFLCRIFHIYTQLRQQDYLFKTLVDTIQTSDATFLEETKKILSHAKITREIAAGVSSCPHSQLKTLFNLFNAWFCEKMKNDTMKERVECISKLFVLLVQNVRVENHTASEIFGLCDSGLSGTALRLLECGNGLRNGLLLCGWLVELQTRCLFWIGSDDDLDTSSKVFLPILKNAYAGSVPEYADCSYELAFLACHRMRQLHSLLHEQQKESWWNTDKGNDGLDRKRLLHEELFSLIHFIFERMAAEQKNEMDRQETKIREGVWALVSSFLPIWTPYCTDDHAKLFLEVMMHHLSSRESTRSHEAKIAFTLSCDATFFEQTILMKHIHSGGLSFAIRLVTEVQIFDSTIISNVDCAVDVSHKNWKELSPSDLQAIAGSPGLSYACCDFDAIKQVLISANSVLRAIDASAMVKLADCASLFHMLYKLELIFRSILLSGEWSSDENLQMALVATRNLLRRTFSNELESLMKGMNVRFCLEAVKGFSLTDKFATNKLLKATDKVCEHMVFVVAKTLNKDTCQPIVDWLTKLETPQMDFMALHRIIRGLMLGKCENLIDSTVLEQLTLACRHLYESLIDNMKVAEPKERAIILYADMLKLFGEPSSRQSIDVQKLATQKGAVSYLIGALEETGTNEKCSQVWLKDIFLTRDSLEPLDGAIFASLAKRLQKDDVQEIAAHLIAKEHSLFGINVFRLLVEAVEDAECRQVLSEYTQHFFDLSLNEMGSISRRAGGSQVIQLFISTLIGNRDLFTFKERDIAITLSRVVSMTCQETAGNEEGGDFAVACKIVSSLLQKFPKQLYTCVPSLMMALQQILRFALKANVSRRIEAKMAQEMARLFELLLPHRDVLKKHILALVLDFVQALASDMSPQKKRELSPCIFSLLDNLSQFEINHLNILTDATSKTVFRTFYQSYQKLHVYKGQY